MFGVPFASEILRRAGLAALFRATVGLSDRAARRRSQEARLGKPAVAQEKEKTA